MDKYIATDRRYYNGTPCTDLKRERDRTARLEQEMKKLDKTANCTYFPMEEKFLVFIGLKELTGTFHNEKQDALIEAVWELKRRHKKWNE